MDVPARHDDEKVGLDRVGAAQHHIGVPFGSDQAVAFGVAEPSRHGNGAQTVAFRWNGGTACPAQRFCDEADAIQPVFRVAPVQAEPFQ